MYATISGNLSQQCVFRVEWVSFRSCPVKGLTGGKRLTEAGLEPSYATRICDNDLRKTPISQLPESIPSSVILPPEVWDRLPESLRASLMVSILEAERGEAM